MQARPAALLKARLRQSPKWVALFGLKNSSIHRLLALSKTPVAFGSNRVLNCALKIARRESIILFAPGGHETRIAGEGARGALKLNFGETKRPAVAICLRNERMKEGGGVRKILSSTSVLLKQSPALSRSAAQSGAEALVRIVSRFGLSFEAINVRRGTKRTA